MLVLESGDAGELQIFNLSTDGALATMTRGVCAAGLRQTLDAKGRLICVRAPSFPDAFNSEAADPDAATEHEQACGKWIKSRASRNRPSTFRSLTRNRWPTGHGRTETRIRPRTHPRRRRSIPCGVSANDYQQRRGARGEHLRAAQAGRSGRRAGGPRGTRRAGLALCDAPAALGVTFDSSGFAVAAVEGSLLDAEAASKRSTPCRRAACAKRCAPLWPRWRRRPGVDGATDARAAVDAASGAIRNSWLDDGDDRCDGQCQDRGRLASASFCTPSKRPISTTRATSGVAANCAFATRATTTGSWRTGPCQRRRASPNASNVAARSTLAAGHDRFAPINSSWSYNHDLTWSSCKPCKGCRRPASATPSMRWHPATVAFPTPWTNACCVTSTRLDLCRP